MRGWVIGRMRGWVVGRMAGGWEGGWVDEEGWWLGG